MKNWVTPQLVSSLTEVIDTAIELTSADFGNVQLLDNEDQLRIVAQRHFPAWWLEYWETASAEHGACGTSLMNGERVFVEDVEQSPLCAGKPSLEIQRRAGVRAMQSTPLRDKSGKWVGMFSTYYRTPFRPDAKMLKVIDLLAVHAASLVENERAAQVLRQRGELLRQAMDAANAGSWMVNLITGELIASERTRALHGVPPDTPLTHSLALTYHCPEDRMRIDAAVRHTAETGEPFRMELRVLLPNGATRWVASYGERRDENGQPCVIGLVQDITERKRLEEQLEASEFRYRSVVADQTEVICRYLPDGTFVFVNEVFCRLFGKTAEELIGKRWQPEAHPDDLSMIEAKLAEMTQANPIVTIENRAYVAGGEIRWMQFVNRGIYDAAGSLKELQAVGRDITERKIAEQKAADSQHLLGLAVSGAELGIWDMDIVSRRSIYDERYCGMLGYQVSEIEPTMDGWMSLVHPDDRQAANEAMRAHMAGETSIFELEHRLRHKKGHWVWVLACGKITYDAEGRPVRASGIHQDISSRKRVSTEGAVLLKRIEGLISGLDKRVGAAGDMSPRSTSTGVRLSERNREILERIAEGKSTAAMAEELGISPATAKTHRRNLMRKLGLNNQAELIRYAIKHKIVNV